MCYTVFVIRRGVGITNTRYIVVVPVPETVGFNRCYVAFKMIMLEAEVTGSFTGRTDKITIYPNILYVKS